MLIVSLSGRGIVVYEGRHTSHFFLLQDSCVITLTLKACSLGDEATFSNVFGGIFRDTSKLLCMPYIEKFSLLYHVLRFRYVYIHLANNCFGCKRIIKICCTVRDGRSHAKKKQKNTALYIYRSYVANTMCHATFV